MCRFLPGLAIPVRVAGSQITTNLSRARRLTPIQVLCLLSGPPHVKKIPTPCVSGSFFSVFSFGPCTAHRYFLSKRLRPQARACANRRRRLLGAGKMGGVTSVRFSGKKINLSAPFQSAPAALPLPTPPARGTGDWPPSAPRQSLWGYPPPGSGGTPWADPTTRWSPPSSE